MTPLSLTMTVFSREANVLEAAMNQHTTGIKSKLATMVAVAALSVTGLMHSAFAEGKQDFTLHNETGVTINKLFISTHDKDEWEEDVLGVDQLAAGAETTITFDAAEEANKWDMKVEDTEGNSLEWHDLKLSEITDITLHWDADKGEGTAETENGQ